MSEKFTPGPWELVSVGDKCKHLCPSKDNVSILTVSLEYNDDDGDPTYFGSVYKPEDAYLIAAAPDMYEALKALIYRAEEQWPYKNTDVHRAIEYAKSALAKADGKTP